MKKTNRKLWIQLMKMDIRSLRNLVQQFTGVSDISLTDLNVKTVIDGDIVIIDEMRFYYGDDLFFYGKSHENSCVSLSYDIYEIPRGGLTDIILTLESRLKG